ncbi:MAG: BLUF domain-containing protein [Cyclobacteriaceae bacterium]
MEKSELKREIITALDGADEQLLRILNAVIGEYKPVHEENTDLYRLVYTSARTKQCTEQDIEEILLTARKNNAKLGITGMLIHTSTRFLQILEGEHDKVMRLYNTIEKDPRHIASRMRFCEKVDQRYFSEWNMAFKQIDSDAIQFNTNITKEQLDNYDSMLDGDINSYRDHGMRILKIFLQSV